MFNSLISKFRSVLKDDWKIQPVAKTIEETVKKLEPELEVEKNRVSLKKKSTESVQVVNKDSQEVIKKKVDEIVKKELEIKERDIFNRLKSLSEKERYVLEKERNLDKLAEQIETKKEAVDEMYKKQIDKLEQISGLSVSEAKDIIVKNVEKKMADWVAKKIVEAKEEIKKKEDEIVQNLVLESIHHGVTDYIAEYTISSVDVSDEKIKGKIIGREGRNIRAFEKLTGVELEMDEDDRVIISSFDPVRREIAKIALEKLIKDGRIQPVRIEQIVDVTRKSMDRILLNEGQNICREVGLFNLPSGLIQLIGKYKYRFSYGQNLAKHSIEVAKIAGGLARQLNLNVNLAKLAALVHDVGKVSDEEEGNHVDLGVEILKKFNMPETIVSSVEESHADKPFSNLYSAISYLADAISGSRPGSRYDGHEEYLKRMKNIELIARDRKGVRDVAAYQAGREVMVVVDPEQVSDEEAIVMAQDIAESLEEEAKWAGRIRVTTVRETRSSFTKQKSNRLDDSE